MSVKFEFEADCCSCFTGYQNLRFVLYSLNKIAVAQAAIVMDSFMFFLGPQVL